MFDKGLLYALLSLSSWRYILSLTGEIAQEAQLTDTPDTHDSPDPGTPTVANEIEASLIIPAHNEEERLLNTLFAYEEALYNRFGNGFEIIVVANGCNDHTAQVAQGVATNLPEIEIVDIERPIGKGGAVLEGFRRARGDKVLFADADGATTPASLIHLCTQLEYHDVVIGSRRLPESIIAHKEPLMRRVFGRMFRTTVRMLFGLPFQDTQCGAKAFRREAAVRLAQVVRETSWTFDVDLLLSAKGLGLDVYEYPVVWSHHSGSQLHFVPTTYDVLWSLWRMEHRQFGPSEDRSCVPTSELKAGKDSNSEVATWHAS